MDKNLMDKDLKELKEYAERGYQRLVGAWIVWHGLRGVSRMARLMTRPV